MRITRTPDLATVRAVYERAARAPSLHNSQPWRWRWDGARAALLVDRDRLLPATDSFNREGILGCGAMLHHGEVAWAAAGWDTRTARFPSPTVRGHIATIEPRDWCEPREADRELGAAIDRRYSDRMPMDPPPEWVTTPKILEFLGDRSHTRVTFLDGDGVDALRRISQLTWRLRRYDPKYGAELSWWTSGPERNSDGVPAAGLPAAPDRGRVPLGREFPAGSAASPDCVADDAAEVVVLSTESDSVEAVLDCGYALSAILLECTVHDLSTCTVSHVTELPSSRAKVTDLVGHSHPQVLVRIGSARTPAPPRSPRRSVDSVLDVEVRGGAPMIRS
ncbi:Acg family FMN-binding oxidoreductase [Nocardia ignorata]|uniref:Acg family FMN-binding oxidoreductase n=1 Tax=Nocardia ignorata TaxID=145285 RepID=UPI00362F7ABB